TRWGPVKVRLATIKYRRTAPPALVEQRDLQRIHPSPTTTGLRRPGIARRARNPKSPRPRDAFGAEFPTASTAPRVDAAPSQRRGRCPFFFRRSARRNPRSVVI